jgi:hypothetical protein
MKNVFTLLAIAALVCSCGKNDRQDSEQPGDSTMETAIGGFTGKTAIDAGKKARKDIERISAQKNKDLEEALE